MKKIGIIGSGAVGQALAKGFLGLGYTVTIASRNPEKRKELESKIEGILTDDPGATAQWADMIVFAVKGSKAKEALEELGVENLAGKTIIDTTNPIADAPPVNGVIPYFSSINFALMEELQIQAPGAHFVKAFCSVGSGQMVNPSFSERPSMFICGNNDEAKKEVSAIVEQFGWEAEDMGKAEAARAIEPLAMLWCIPGFLSNSWNHAFKLLKR